MSATDSSAAANIRLYPWFRFFRSLTFWHAVWFLFFQNRLSAAEAILLYAIYDLSVTLLEVPSGYMSDRLGRRLTLIASALAGFAGALALALGDSFLIFALAQVLIGAGGAFASGTDSAFLYESLAAEDRADEIERQELRAWRFSFVALAFSAVAGGAMAMAEARLPFFAGAVAGLGVLYLTWRFREPPGRPAAPPAPGAHFRLATLRASLAHPVLVWLFWLSVLMYVFSHIPYVFGQPFILAALAETGLDGDAPVISGAVTAVMMAVSVATSLIAPRLRGRFGLAPLLLMAFALQIALSAVLALTDRALAIAVLFLRMVPDSLSKPFILARIQPLLGNESRATYLSLQSLAGRLIFALTLAASAGQSSTTGAMAHDEIQNVLGWYVLVGVVAVALLALAATRVRLEARADS